jgi:hypothetical protein
MTARRIVSCLPSGGRHSQPGIITPTVPTIGLQRRIQAMSWMHWSLEAQALRAGIPVDEYTAVLHGTQADPLTAKKIIAVYELLSMTFGDDLDAHWAAIANGWFPPLAWDEPFDGTLHSIDGEFSTPCVVPQVGRVDPKVNELQLQSWAAEHDPARAAGLDIDTRNDLMRRLSRNGHTTRTLGPLFGVSRQTAALITKPDQFRGFSQ